MEKLELNIYVLWNYTLIHVGYDDIQLFYCSNHNDFLCNIEEKL